MQTVCNLVAVVDLQTLNVDLVFMNQIHTTNPYHKSIPQIHSQIHILTSNPNPNPNPNPKDLFPNPNFSQDLLHP